MDWVVVYDMSIDFFMILEDTSTPKGIGAGDMPVRKDISTDVSFYLAPKFSSQAYPLSASTTNPVASEDMAFSPSKDRV